MSFLQLVIFDCDGVLADSERITNTVLVEQLTELGLSVTLADMYDQFVGNSLAHCLAKIEEMLGRPAPDNFVDEYRARTKSALEMNLQPVRGVEAVLAQMTHPYCVASNSDDKKLRMILGLAGVLPLFEGRLFPVDLVARGKPDPALFLHAARAMGAEPARTLVIEDTPIGVTAGVAAGMTVFGYSELMSAERLKQAGAAKTFEDMAQLPSMIHELDSQI